jgi:hypothetical protein
MGIHLLHCAHGNKHTRTRDAIRNTFVTIARDVGFHVGGEKIHAFPSNFFNPFCRWVNIVFTKDGIHTLINVVIVNLMWTNFLPQSYGIKNFVTFDVA